MKESPRFIRWMIPFTMAAFCLTALPRTAWARERSFHFGVSLPYYTLTGGHFDGEHSLTASGQFVPIPKIHGAVGFEAAAGMGDAQGSFEVAFSTTAHTFEIFDPRPKYMGLEERSAPINRLAFNYIRTGRKETGLRPFFLLGLGFCWFKIDASFFEQDIFGQISPPYPYKNSGDSRYSGLFLNFGGGVAIPLGSHLSMLAGAKLQPTYFGKLNNRDNSGEDWPFTINALGFGLEAFLRIMFRI